MKHLTRWAILLDGFIRNNIITQGIHNEEEINNILDKLVSNMVMCNFEDIVNDLVKTRLCAY